MKSRFNAECQGTTEEHTNTRLGVEPKLGSNQKAYVKTKSCQVKSEQCYHHFNIIHA